jgi:HK97 family phage major capsid protein
MTDLLDRKAVEDAYAKLSGEMGVVADMLTKSKAEAAVQFKDLATHYNGVKADNEELKAVVKKHTEDYAAMLAKSQALEEGMNNLKKEMEAPIYKGGKDLDEADRKSAVNLQLRTHINKGYDPEIFKPDMSNLIAAADYRSAMRKFSKAGLISKAEIVKSFTDVERKAFESSSMDGHYFLPEMLGIEVDCNVECQYLNDLYEQVTVGRTQFMYPVVVDYAAIGSYQCDANCDTDLGPEGNLTYRNGTTYTYRGMFCLAKNVVAEANYDLMGFMVRSIQRSERINKNRVMMTGTGVNEPKGWITEGGFQNNATSGLSLNHQNVRRFLSSAPIEYGEITAVMHQNVFSYIASAVDSTGRFIFGDGELIYSPNNVNARIRISNCMPDPTAGGTRGNALGPFVAGDMVMAAANWKTAITEVTRNPMSMELYIGGSTKWCQKWQFSSENGSFTKCHASGRTLSIGA